jgi:hypothetical protein
MDAVRQIESGSPRRSRLKGFASRYLILSLFWCTILLIVIVWWPLAEEQLALIDWRQPLWGQLDWLLVGLFGVMSLLIMVGADLKADVRIVLVGLVGGLVIESWGTQTNLWHYYTFERPPLWIIPAWPIASLSIDRLYRFINRLLPPAASRMDPFKVFYWLIFPAFYAIMLSFVWPTLDKSLTLSALVLCAFLLLTPLDSRAMVLTFTAGAGLGYFLELWGTTRACWTYHTGEMPPFFAVLAHGMAAVAFWRTAQLIRLLWPRLALIPATWFASFRTNSRAAIRDQQQD